jgi:uncharacterized damage-inducible protein DinB
MEQVKWFERSFDFSNNQNIMPSVIERLAGTPLRLEYKLNSLPPEILNIKYDGAWSVKENAGHLTDLEPIWQGRLEDILLVKKELREADLLNTKTNNANHNDVPVDVLINQFKEIREKTVSMLQQISPEEIFRAALHPRLKTPMRTIDLFTFVAEHDDHHLARITELSKLIADT